MLIIKILTISDFPFIDVDECKNNAGMTNYSVCVNGECQNTMKNYMCVCHAGFRSDVTKKLCNGRAFKLICCLIIHDVFFTVVANLVSRILGLFGQRVRGQKDSGIPQNTWGFSLQCACLNESENE